MVYIKTAAGNSQSEGYTLSLTTRIPQTREAEMGLAVLLIEDNAQTARLVEKVLSSRGHTVLWAATGLVGLKMARENQPNLVLIDLDLPDLEGKVVVNQLRAIPYYAHLPIAAFTADNTPRAKRLALGFGFNDFITKPIDTRTFGPLIEQLGGQVK